MKLFTRYSRVNLLANIAIFLVASLAFYFSLRYVLVKVIDGDLQIEEDEITAYVKKHNRLPESFSISDQIITFSPAVQKTERQFATVRLQKKDENGTAGYRRLQFGIIAAGQPYRVFVAKSLEGTNNLLHSILLVSISTILLILLVSAIINRVLLKQLWQPFYHSLSAVRRFRPSKDRPLSLPPSSIDEFNLMNQTLEEMTKTSRLEYVSLKTFSENAAHEIQTPIAIIRTKLDLLIQEEGLTERQSKTLQSAYNAVEKLTRLNSSLLLLAKIENNQFEERTELDLKEKLQEKTDDFHELWQAKELTVQSVLQPTTVCMNRELADILLNNLLSNATNHNYPGGSLSIALSNDALTISNTSAEPALDTNRLFQRFYKTATVAATNGLGLSIIQQIAEASGFAVRYSYQKRLHQFTLHFSPVKT